MPELSSKLTFISDPGHGWLRVPLVDVARLGFEGEMIPFSFIQGRYAFLEEDGVVPAT